MPKTQELPIKSYAHSITYNVGIPEIEAWESTSL